MLDGCIETLVMVYLRSKVSWHGRRTSPMDTILLRLVSVYLVHGSRSAGLKFRCHQSSRPEVEILDYC